MHEVDSILENPYVREVAEPVFTPVVPWNRSRRSDPRKQFSESYSTVAIPVMWESASMFASVKVTESGYRNSKAR